jgi:phosphate starvation-inducible PhoH-like protein
MKINLTGLNEQGKLSALFGTNDENLKYIEKVYNVNISAINENITITDDDKETEKQVINLIKDLSNSITKGYKINKKVIKYLIDNSKENGLQNSEKLFSSFIRVGHQKGFVQPKTFGQEKYLQALKESDFTVCVGPAGTGKTYLAVARAVESLLEHEVTRLIVTRPAVEAGEKLGFLPGDIAQKIDPYLKPIFDALYEHLSFNKAAAMMEKGIIEVAPLAFMRGRTLNDSFIILDEGQNTTIEQMKMLLTRVGYSSKLVVTGDITQIDLINKKQSGLVVISKILRGIDGIEIINLSRNDVVRHPIVQKIIDAFTKYEQKK